MPSASTTRRLFPILLVNFIGTLGFSIVLPFLAALVGRLGGNALVRQPRGNLRCLPASRRTYPGSLARHARPPHGAVGQPGRHADLVARLPRCALSSEHCVVRGQLRVARGIRHHGSARRSLHSPRARWSGQGKCLGGERLSGRRDAGKRATAELRPLGRRGQSGVHSRTGVGGASGQPQRARFRP